MFGQTYNADSIGGGYSEMNNADRILALYRRGLSLEDISISLGISLVEAATVIARYNMMGDSPPAPTPQPVAHSTPENQTGEIIVGIAVEGGSTVFWNPTATANPHLMVLGQSGTGKTYSIQCLLLELLKVDIPAVVVDYGQGFNLEAAEEQFKRATRVKELWVGRDGLQLNPLEIRPTDVNGPKNVAVRVASTLRRIYTNIGDQQQFVLAEAILECFRTKGIYPAQPTTWTRPHPHLDDLSRLLDQYISDDEYPHRQTAEKVRSHLGAFFMYDTFRSSGTDFDWGSAISDKAVTILQLKGLDGKTQRVVTEFLLWDLYLYMESSGPKPLSLFVVLDEAHNLDFESRDTPVEKIVREARKFGLGMILASQQPKDFSDAAFANTDSKLVFQVDDDGRRLAKRLAKKTRLTPQEVEQTLAGLEKATALFVSQNKGVVCKILSLDQR